MNRNIRQKENPDQKEEKILNLPIAIRWGTDNSLANWWCPVPEDLEWIESTCFLRIKPLNPRGKEHCPPSPAPFCESDRKPMNYNGNSQIGKDYFVIIRPFLDCAVLKQQSKRWSKVAKRNKNMINLSRPHPRDSCRSLVRLALGKRENGQNFRAQKRQTFGLCAGEKRGLDVWYGKQCV